MKVKTDFVTNSSSTSFIIMAEDDFAQDDFLELMGVDKESDFYDMFSRLYDELSYGMEEVEEAINDQYWGTEHSTVKELIEEQFSVEVYLKYLDAKKENKKTYIGKLSSDQEPLVSYLCMDSFIEENEKIYFHYTNCVW